MAVAAETTLQRSRRRRRFWGRTLQSAVPYRLILPVVVVIGLILGYPLYWLVRLSTQQYGLFELIRHSGTVGRSAQLRLRPARPGLLAHAPPHGRLHGRNVALTIVFGMLLALLLVRVSTSVRVLLTSGLVLVWSMPVVVAVQVWYWMTNFENGVVNYVLTQLHIGDFFQHDWYATTFSQLTPRDAADRLGRAAVRRDHALRRPRAGAARPRRGGRGRRRAAVARVPRHHAADPASRSCSSSRACRSSGTSASSRSRTC